MICANYQNELAQNWRNSLRRLFKVALKGKALAQVVRLMRSPIGATLAQLRRRSSDRCIPPGTPSETFALKGRRPAWVNHAFRPGPRSKF
jgi:hypothetical protein